MIAKMVGGVSLLVSMTGSTGCVDGESLSTANYGFRISSPNSTTGLGRVQFIIATANLVTLAPIHMCARVQCAINSMRLVQKVTIIFVNTFMVNVNILLYISGDT